MHYLVTGPSGSGKTSVAAHLQARGFVALDGDDGIPDMAHFRDNLGRGPAQEYTPALGLPWLLSHHWWWDGDRLRRFLREHAEETVFICGGADNVHTFLNLFDKVFYLEATLPTLMERLVDEKRQHKFGFGRYEHERTYVREVMLPYYRRNVASRDIVQISSDQPLEAIVDQILEASKEVA